MIDIHSHIFWCENEGPATRETSLAMLRVARESGTTDIVGTPYYTPEFPRDFVRKQMLDLNRYLDGQPRVHAGCEFRLAADHLPEILERPDWYTINGGPYLLVDIGDGAVPPATEQHLARLAGAKITPIVVHPERNAVLTRNLDRLAEWYEHGVLVQVGAASLEGGFGAVAMDAAWRMLLRRMVHFVASEARDPQYRPPRLDLARELVRRKMGDPAAEALFVRNPRVVVDGGHPDRITAATTEPRRGLRRFFKLAR